MLLRRGGRLVLSEAPIAAGEFWEILDDPPRAPVDLPHVVEPLGPWPYGPIEAPEPEDARKMSRTD